MYSQKWNYLFDKLPDKDVSAIMGFFQQTQFITPVLSSTVKKYCKNYRVRKQVVPRSEDTWVCREMTAKDISFPPV